MNKKYYDILLRKKCVNCNSSYVKIISKPYSDVIMCIGLFLFLLNLMVSIIPFVGVFFRKYLLWNFAIFVIGLIIYNNSNKNKDIYWIRCDNCGSIYSSELEDKLDKIVEDFKKLDDSIESIENRQKKVQSMLDNLDNEFSKIEKEINLKK